MEATGPTSFSNDGSHILDHHTDVNSVKVDNDKFDTTFEIDRCVQIIMDQEYNKIGLQFPDELLNYAVKISRKLQEKLTKGQSVYILGDTTYGSCCVDEITAEHAQCDFVIHFGRACLTPVERIPVLFVFGKLEIDVNHCVDTVFEKCENLNSPTLLLYDVVYEHAADKIYSGLQTRMDKLVKSSLAVPNTYAKKTDLSSDIIEKTEDDGENVDEARPIILAKTYGRKFNLLPDTKIGDYTIIYIGSEGAALTNIMISYNQCQFLTYDPLTSIGRIETLNINRALMKRYYLIQKAKDANIVGIILGTLGAGKYGHILEYLKKIIAGAGKKSYTCMLGTVNELKVANFLEIDIYVLVACPESSFLDSKDFFRPVVTPFEMQLACVRGKDWTGDFLTDFHDVLPRFPVSDERYTYDSDEEADFSLLTGEYRPRRKGYDVKSKDVSVRNNSNQIVTASDWLTTRSYQGLEQNLGQTEVKKAVLGTTGIAKGYTRIDHDNEDNDTDEEKELIVR